MFYSLFMETPSGQCKKRNWNYLKDYCSTFKRRTPMLLYMEFKCPQFMVIRMGKRDGIHPSAMGRN